MPGDAQPEPASRTGSALHLQAPAQKCDTLFDTHQSESAGTARIESNLPRIESRSVILHRHMEVPIVHNHMHASGRDTGMFDGIEEQFSDRLENKHLHFS